MTLAAWVWIIAGAVTAAFLVAMYFHFKALEIATKQPTQTEALRQVLEHVIRDQSPKQVVGGKQYHLTNALPQAKSGDFENVIPMDRRYVEQRRPERIAL